MSNEIRLQSDLCAHARALGIKITTCCDRLGFGAPCIRADQLPAVLARKAESIVAGTRKVELRRLRKSIRKGGRA